MQHQEESLSKDGAIPSKIIAIIHRYRDGEAIDLSVVKSTVGTDVSLVSSSSALIEEISNTTVTHYTDKLNQMPDILSTNVATFLTTAMDNERKLFELLNLPLDLCKDIFRRIVESIRKDFPNDEAFAVLVNEKKHDKLKNFYQLCKIGSCVHHIHLLWDHYLTDRVTDFYEEDLLIDDFMELNNEFIHVVTECFEAHEDMSKQFFKFVAKYIQPVYPPPGCGRGVQQRPNLPAQMCVNSIDEKLSEVIANQLSIEELGSWMQHVIDLFFPYLDMGYFRKFYKSALLRRYVRHKTLVMDAERLVWSKVPDLENGEQILNDIEVKQKTDQRWKEYLTAKKINFGMTLEAKLIDYNWCESSVLSPELRYPSEVFNATYDVKLFLTLIENSAKFIRVMKIYGGFVDYCTTEDGHHRRRHVVYKRFTSHSNCKMIGNFKRGSKKILVTVEQAAVLLLFNDNNALSFEEISDKTDLGTERVREILFPIVRSGILVPNHKNYSDVETLQYGKEFTSVQDNFIFTEFKRKEPMGSAKKDEVKMLVMAAIVRIAKRCRKTLEQNLIIEVKNQLATRASVRVRDITKAISSLIEREFLARSAEDEKIIEYLD